MPHNLRMSTREQILGKIETHLQASGMSERQFGLEVAKDHKLLRRLRSGAGVTLTVIERIEAFISANPPPARQAGNAA